MAWRTFTAASALVVRDERLLMILERRPSGLWWSVPGGYADAGESLEETAARESEEETGVAVSVGPLVCTLLWEYPAQERRNVIAYFAATATAAEPVLQAQAAEQIEVAEFVAPTSLAPAEIHPQTRAVLERWWPDRADCLPFHLVADIVMDEAGTAEYVFHP